MLAGITGLALPPGLGARVARLARVARVGTGAGPRS